MRTAAFVMLSSSLICCLRQSAATAATADAPVWNQAAAAAYLDNREAWWSGWDQSVRDHDTHCVSCHTAVPYALARPVLRNAMGEKAPVAPENALFAGVTKRVTLWNEVEPFYPDKTRGVPKTAESRGTEAVMNALILVSRDALNNSLSKESQTALDNMWALQLKDGDTAGAWTWLNFHNAPWEGEESQFWGATLGAVAAGRAPESYRKQSAVQEDIKLLKAYFNRTVDAQPLFNKAGLLWASGELPGLLTSEQKHKLVQALIEAQNPDGGWSTSRLGPSWKRRDNTPEETNSDGYATALVAYALKRSHAAESPAPLNSALGWLVKNQSGEGFWAASSLNKQRDPATDVGKFMTDAATAYAVLALEATP